MSRVVSDIYWKAMAGLTVWNMFAGSTEPVWSSEILTKCAPVAWLRIRIHDMLLNLFVISSSIWKKNTLNTCHQINFKFGVINLLKTLFGLTLFWDLVIILEMFVKFKFVPGKLRVSVLWSVSTPEIWEHTTREDSSAELKE